MLVTPTGWSKSACQTVFGHPPLAGIICGYLERSDYVSLGATNPELYQMIQEQRNLILQDSLATQYVRNLDYARQRLTGLFCQTPNVNLILHFQFGRDIRDDLNLPGPEDIEVIRTSPHKSVALSIVDARDSDIGPQTFAGLRVSRLRLQGPAPRSLDAFPISDLIELDLSESAVVDISGVNRGLETLQVSKHATKIKNLTDGLVGLERLKSFTWKDSVILEATAYAFFIKIPSVTHVDLIDSYVTFPDGIQHLKNLEHLVAKNSNFTRLPPLIHLEALKTIDLEKCESLVDIRGLSGLQKLETLDISFSQISDLAPISTSRTLKMLSLRGVTSIKTLEALRGMASLRILDIRETNIPDASTLTASNPFITILSD